MQKFKCRIELIISHKQQCIHFLGLTWFVHASLFIAYLRNEQTISVCYCYKAEGWL
jgi:hypothetical protein